MVTVWLLRTEHNVIRLSFIYNNADTRAYSEAHFIQHILIVLMFLSISERVGIRPLGFWNEKLLSKHTDISLTKQHAKYPETQVCISSSSTI